jgi:enoyl-CoA hydratase/carnithine racemase
MNHRPHTRQRTEDSREHVRTHDFGPVRHVIFSRAEKRNALSSKVYRELGEAFADAASAPDIRCVVLRGDGPIFSAGNDVDELAGLAADPSAVRRGRPIMLAAVNALEEMPKPTIAQIHGMCIGGAAELALACDLRVMTTDAQIALFETKLGLIPDLGGCSRLPSIIGLGRAKEMVMTARPVDADEALRIGLVARVGPRTASVAPRPSSLMHYWPTGTTLLAQPSVCSTRPTSRRWPSPWRWRSRCRTHSCVPRTSNNGSEAAYRRVLELALSPFGPVAGEEPRHRQDAALPARVPRPPTAGADRRRDARAVVLDGR